MRIIKAKFNSKCAETGKFIPKGVNCVYDPARKKVYCLESETANDALFDKNVKPYLRPDPEEKYYSGYTTYLERDSDHGQDY